uniref:BRCT domain-containing protein n=1 Tax=Peronospora matthiolae TaxID=2874970 RepID=A0AAV1VM74_9STRA
MFAVNGPSGPTSRNERRAKSGREQEEEETIRKIDAAKKREQFFQAKRALPDKRKEGPENPVKSVCASDIFTGCRIVFNGRTGKVSSYNLAKLVQEHGGNVASALTATRVTHMVGSNLNGSKADKVLKSASRLKFVTPEWILQSVKLKKRQPEFDFLVYKDNLTLCTMFSRTASSPK